MKGLESNSFSRRFRGCHFWNTASNPVLWPEHEANDGMWTNHDYTEIRVVLEGRVQSDRRHHKSERAATRTLHDHWPTKESKQGGESIWCTTMSDQPNHPIRSTPGCTFCNRRQRKEARKKNSSRGAKEDQPQGQIRQPSIISCSVRTPLCRAIFRNSFCSIRDPGRRMERRNWGKTTQTIPAKHATRSINDKQPSAKHKHNHGQKRHASKLYVCHRFAAPTPKVVSTSVHLPWPENPSRRWSGARVGVGMLRGSCFLGFKVPWFLGMLVSCCLVVCSVSWVLRLKAPKIERFTKVPCHVWKILIPYSRFFKRIDRHFQPPIFSKQFNKCDFHVLGFLRNMFWKTIGAFSSSFGVSWILKI